MQSIDKFIQEHPQKTFFLILLLAIPAFFINLGLLPLFADEPTRANVALEMILSGNWAVPTVGSDFYYNKPPVYNWMLACVYLLAGNFSEFSTRLPAIIPLFIFSITIFYVVKHFLKDSRTALLSALLLLLNGRMLIYDSMLGHIDIFYSWLTFVAFICIYHFFKKGNWFMLFFTSYLITAVTFLCKGMPSIVFQGFTIIAFLVYTRNFKKFLSWQHIVSGLICVALIAVYFYNYSRYNNNLDGYLATIWDQSSRRTAASVGLWKTVKHLLLFPFEYLGHLFPASLLVLFCFHKRFVEGLAHNGFLGFCIVVFFANIWVYWLSPETRPRYLIMLFPLLFIVWADAYYRYRESLSRINKVFNISIAVLAVLVTCAFPAALFFDVKHIVANLIPKVVVLSCLGAIMAFLILKLKEHKVVAFLGLLLVLRLGFSWLILPKRLEDDEGRYFRSASEDMAIIAGDSAFYFYQYHPEIPAIPFHDKLIFYIQRKRMQQVKFTENDEQRGYYLTFDRDLKNPKAVLVKSYDSNLKLFKVE